MQFIHYASLVLATTACAVCSLCCCLGARDCTLHYQPTYSAAVGYAVGGLAFAGAALGIWLT